MFIKPLQDTSFGIVVSTFTASDADSGNNGVVTFRVVNNVPFRFDSANLIVNGPLDRETNPQYSVSKLYCTIIILLMLYKYHKDRLHYS